MHEIKPLIRTEDIQLFCLKGFVFLPLSAVTLSLYDKEAAQLGLRESED